MLPSLIYAQAAGVPMRTHYDLLGVRSDADDEVLRKAYHKAAKANHPDLNSDDPDAPPGSARSQRLLKSFAIRSSEPLTTDRWTANVSSVG
jgi:curved DNA-binding protein CbpA